MNTNFNRPTHAPLADLPVPNKDMGDTRRTMCRRGTCAPSGQYWNPCPLARHETLDYGWNAPPPNLDTSKEAFCVPQNDRFTSNGCIKSPRQCQGSIWFKRDLKFVKKFCFVKLLDCTRPEANSTRSKLRPGSVLWWHSSYGDVICKFDKKNLSK